MLLAQDREKPNIIFIMADDMGIDWVSAYGAPHPTPSIDRLAEQGLQFNNVWCNPICTPTRVELLTGMYPFRTGWTSHHDVPRWGGKGFDWEKFICFARVVKQAGYATAIGGKWQVNDFRHHPDALKRHGFDEHCMWTGYETGNAPPSDERYWNAYLMTNGERKVHKGQFGSTVVNDFLIDFIKRHRDRPFLVYYPMLLPHGPRVLTPFNKEDPTTRKAELYAGMVTYLDHLVGRITQTIDQLGLSENTIIIFTCDNGSSVAGRLGGKPYAKGKGRVANYGANVPFVLRAPFLTGNEVGRVSEDLIDFTDMYPTFVELAGGKMPQGVRFDGRSIVGLIDGSVSTSRKRRWIYAQRGDGRMVRDKRYLLDNEGRVYDLKADPLQQNNLADITDPAAVEARKRLGQVLHTMPADAGPPFDLYRKRVSVRKNR
ncbi:MAG: sulfatase-like hydrolase/transferase [Woeseiaceae bacterium]